MKAKRKRRRGKSITVVLGRNRPHDWVSMREIVPSIERAWAASASPEHDVRFVRFSSPRDVLRRIRELDSADRIVLPVLDNRLDFDFLDRKLGIRKPLILHLHGECTYAGVSLRRIEPFLERGSVLVCSSEAEARTARLVYQNPRVALLPFPIPALTRLKPARPTRQASARGWVYAGRISEQKNLHTLILALWILKRSGSPLAHPSLEIYGKEDRLGSPNMRKASEDYLGFLKRLAHRLGLEKEIVWHGFTPREKLDRILKRRIAREGISFVSPSLHSDEDFGVAALKFALWGGTLALSAWGGHRDLGKNFRSQIRLVPVEGSDAGPFLDPWKLAQIMMAGAKGGSSTQDAKPYYLPSARKALTALVRSSPRKASFKRTPLGQRALSQHLEFKPPLGRFSAQHTFHDYSDPLARPFFEAYGMKRPKRLSPRPRFLWVLPWVEFRPGGIRVKDPHRGEFRFSENKNAKPAVEACLLPGTTRRISAEAARWLLRYGFAFSRSRF